MAEVMEAEQAEVKGGRTAEMMGPAMVVAALVEEVRAVVMASVVMAGPMEVEARAVAAMEEMEEVEMAEVVRGEVRAEDAVEVVRGAGAVREDT